jgi:hypothetical protein
MADLNGAAETSGEELRGTGTKNYGASLASK